MANLNVNQLGVLAVAASNDEIPIWDVSSGQQLKITRAALIGALLTGGGTINTGGVTLVLTGGGTLDLGGVTLVLTGGGTLDLGDGSLAVTGNQTLIGSITGGGVLLTAGFNLTLPASCTAAGRELPNVFLAVQGIEPIATNQNGLNIDMPHTTTAKALVASYNGEDRLEVTADGGSSILNMSTYDAGAGAGPIVRAGRNSNGSTPAPGVLSAIQANASGSSMWPDNSGVWRTVQDTNVTNANFASAGTVVGAQTSHRDFKDVIGEAVDDATALAFICQAAEQVARFVYKSGAYGGEEFSGVVLDGPELDRYGMDADEERPAGKALNVINAIGDLFKAVRVLSERVTALEGA